MVHRCFVVTKTSRQAHDNEKYWSSFYENVTRVKEKIQKKQKIHKHLHSQTAGTTIQYKVTQYKIN